MWHMRRHRRCQNTASLGLRLSSPECTPGVELALETLDVGEKVNDVQICEVLPGGNAGCENVVQFSSVPKRTQLAATQEQ